MNKKQSRTERLIQSFAAVEILPEHRNYGNDGPYLRGFGFPSAIAAKLIRFGEQNDLVCTLENAQGASDGCYYWLPSFLRAAAEKHLEIFGDAGRDDLTADFLDWAFVEANPEDCGA